MPNWPVTTTSITEGTIIKASDLENNFNALKNAANTLHERFSTLSFSCNIDVKYNAYTSTAATEYNRVLGLTMYGDTAGEHVNDVDGYTVFGLFQVPSWCQAVRVRTFDVLNSSVLADSADANIALADHATPLEVGIRYAAAVSTFDQNAASAPGTGITSVTFTSTNAEGYTGSQATYPVIRQTAPSTLVLGGQYIAVYGRGGVKYTTNTTDSRIIAPVHFRFHVNMMCDAMVPIP